jgi:MarR family transcriptional regulator, temperature-dependent positive regulator of motility
MKKFGLLFMALLVSVLITVTPAKAEYLEQYDKEVEVSYEEARQIADLMGFQGIPLGEKTAELSFNAQEKLINKLERILNIEIDHYYIWLTVNGVRVLGIDPPVPMI